MSAGRDPRGVDPGTAARRRGAVRTALVIAAIAAAVYVGFILMGVLAQ
jgi:hypothetical protein